MLCLSSPFEYIPSDWHLSAVVFSALVGFLLIINVSSIKASNEDSENIESDLQSTPSTPIKEKSFGSPIRTPSDTPKITRMGSVETPGGRRSARIAQKPKKQ